MNVAAADAGDREIEGTHTAIARFKFIDARADGPTMVARLPQQVLLLLVLVTGASTGEAEDPCWSTYSTRKTRSSLPRSWPSSSVEHTAREMRLSSSKLAETTPWSVDRSGTRSDPSFLRTAGERSEEEDEDEDGMRVQPLSTANDIGSEANIARHNPSISSPRNGEETPQMDLSNRIAIESPASARSSTIGHRARTSLAPASSHDIVPMSERLSRGNSRSTTMTTTPKNMVIPRRQTRHVTTNCERFQIGDEVKREFYSPNYPETYPNQTDCVRVLEADEGMLLKLDFRDEFKLEDSPGCRFDFLEVRDGRHGFSNLLGNFCGPNFPPEITSKTRYLWLRFHSDENIEGKGFKAVWSMIPRPTYPGVPPEPEACIFNVTGHMEAIIKSENASDMKAQAEKEGLPLDCMWIIQVQDKWKIQLTFEFFKLQRPNECDANFIDIFRDRTDMSSLEKNFCGSIADTVIVQTNIAHVRFYVEPKAMNSSFEAIMTAVRDKDSEEKTCKDGEYDCEDATCIDAKLECNGKANCRFRWDEDDTKCNTKKSRLIDSQHIVIILVVFSLIMFGMSFAFVFNCVRKLVRDHRIIQEHIRQSRENRLDELGRKSTPRPITTSRTDLRDRGSESPSLEVLPSKELMPTTMISQEYTKDLVLEMTYNTGEITDIHQSNNVSNATQERLQESNEEPEMRDNCCQTRESLFESRIPDALVPLGFTTFGIRAPSSQNGTNHHLHHHHHHHHPQQLQSQQQSPQQSQHPSLQSSQPSLQSSQPSSQQQSASQCSGCSPASRGQDGSMGACPKHNPIPAPPGWTGMHESTYPALSQQAVTQYPEQLDYPSYQRYQSPKPSREPSGVYRQSPKFTRQPTVGSGERYGSSMYGSGHGSSNTTSSVSQHSSSATSSAKRQQGQPATTADPRYRAEAVIEVDQRRPFSIESTKSAPDVIATH